MILKYTALASVTFAGLFSVFVVLRADSGSPCPYGDLLYHDPYVPERVVNNHPPPFGTPPRRPLAECASVVVLADGTAAMGEPWLDRVQHAFRLESANHGMNVAAVEPLEGRLDAVIVAYTTYCPDRAAMTASLIGAYEHRYPNGPRLRDATDEADLARLTLAHQQTLWPERAAE